MSFLGNIPDSSSRRSLKYLIGTAPNYNYRSSYHASQNKIEWSVGSLSGSVAVSAGLRRTVAIYSRNNSIYSRSLG